MNKFKPWLRKELEYHRWAMREFRDDLVFAWKHRDWTFEMDSFVVGPLIWRTYWRHVRAGLLDPPATSSATPPQK